MTEEGFVKADSRSLPKIDGIMIAEFFSQNPLFRSSEIRGVKTERAARKEYGDAAIGYVQLKRNSQMCIVKAKICPEHKVRNKPYNVTIMVNELTEQVDSALCHDCAASTGGCKHAAAFLMWVHRRSEEPSCTEVECYWKKSMLSSVGAQNKFVTVAEFGSPPEKRLSNIPEGTFLQSILKNAKERGSSMQLLKHFSEGDEWLNQISIHHLLIKFIKSGSETAEDFLRFSSGEMTEEACKRALKLTVEQSNSKIWHELRYARITASKIYEVAHCKIAPGSLIEQITGGLLVGESKAMLRGKNLEGKVLNVLKKQIPCKFKNVGLHLSPKYPLFGASPDALSDEFVVEIKCPSTSKTMNNYIKDGTINNKFKAQIQLQMHLFNKKRGIFCVAYPSFEVNNLITIHYVDYDKDFVEDIQVAAEEFWKANIFPMLFRSLK